MYYDDRIVIHIVTNLIFHKKINYIQLDYRLILKKIQNSNIMIKYIRSTQQVNIPT